MNTSMVKGIVIGGIAAAAVAASGVTGYRAMTAPEYAEVVAVKEATQTVSTPREECQDVQVQKQAPVKDENRVAGTVLGGVAGGLLGSTIGGGRGKTVATVAGAAAGGYAGNKVQKNMQQKDTVASTERRCNTVTEKTQKRIGYDVTYQLGGKQDVVRMAYDPGQRIPLKDGKLDLTAPAK
ncbi:MAG: glycine zipper 2TM domain-containing protein [Burkholderiales bacterium]